MKNLALVLSLLLAFSSLSSAQDQSPPDRVMELNRAGRWDEAARLAEDYLKDAKARQPADSCLALSQLAYARLRLGQDEQARAALARFDAECRVLPKGHWVHGVTESFRKELEGAPPADLSPAKPRDDFWQTADPASAGVDADALKEHAALCLKTGADACLVVRRGRIVQEVYSPRYREPMYAMSSTKSVTGLLVGMLIEDGKIKSADEPVCRYVAEWCEGRRGKVTIRHLLSMTSGLRRMWQDGVGFTKDKNRLVKSLAPEFEPGIRWDYSNEGVQLLSPLLDRAAGEPIQTYARRRLFEPLGMTRTNLHLDEFGHAWTYADMETTARDFARLGLLMLAKGEWRGRRVVSARWVEESTRRSQPFEKYGLLWWLYDEPKGFAALGYLDTNLYVFPALELVVVRMQSKPVEGAGPYEPAALKLFGRMVRP